MEASLRRTRAAWLGLPPGLASREMALLCAFNALLHAKPSEPHLVPYLIDVKNFSPDAVWNDIFPIFTYSYFAFTLLAAPATQVFGCKACIVAGALSRLSTRLLLLYGSSLASMQVMQVAYGAGVSAEVVFSAYVFARVGPELYQSATSATAAAALVGHLIADEAGQLAVNGGASLTSLFYVSLFTVGGGAVLSLFLPRDQPSAPRPDCKATAPSKSPTLSTRLRATALRSLAVLRRCYSTPALALLSAWWVLASVACFYTEDYGTNLFADIDSSQDANGHVTFVTRSLCTFAALLVIRVERPIAASGLLLYAVATALAGLCIGGLAATPSLLPAYIAYASALTVLQFCTCALYAQCAHALDDASEGTADEVEPDTTGDSSVSTALPPGRAAVLFGANQTVALALQAAVQAFATASRAAPRTQFAVLAGYCFAIAGLTAIAAAATRMLTGTWRIVRDFEPAPRTQDGAAGTCQVDGSTLVAEDAEGEHSRLLSQT